MSGVTSQLLAGSGGSNWQTVFSQTYSADSGGFANYTIRPIIPHSLLSAYTGSPTKIRVTVQGGLAEAFEFQKMYVGHKASSGDAYDATSLSQLLFSGIAGASAPIQPAVLLSDELAFSYNGSSGLVFSAYCNSSNDTLSNKTLSGAIRAYRAGVDVAATADTTGFTEDANTLALITKIELL